MTIFSGKVQQSKSFLDFEENILYLLFFLNHININGKILFAVQLHPVLSSLFYFFFLLNENKIILMLQT